MKLSGPFAVVFFTAIAAAYGCGLASLGGGLTGATVSLATVGMVLVLMTAPEVSALTAARAAAAMAIAATIGGLNPSPSSLVGSVIDDAAFTSWQKVVHHCLVAAARGAVQISIPALFFGVTLSGRTFGRFNAFLLVALLLSIWWSGDHLVDLLPETILTGLEGPALVAVPTAAKRPSMVACIEGITVLASLLAWTRFVQGNRPAFRLGLWGAFAGGVASALAQMVATASIWLPQSLTIPPWNNWLVVLQAKPLGEIFCGAVWGGLLGWGAWRERKAFASTPDVVSLRLPWEIGLMAAHAAILLASLFSANLTDTGIVRVYGQSGLLAAAIPFACCLTGRHAPWLTLLPVAIAPTIGLALRHAAYRSQLMPVDSAWLVAVALPLAFVSAGSAWAAMRENEHVGEKSGVPLGITLLISVTTLFGLAAMLLDFSWPWLKQTPHTTTLTVLMICASILASIAARTATASASTQAASTAVDG